MYGTGHKTPSGRAQGTRDSYASDPGFDVVVVAGSAGAIPALREMLAVLPAHFPAAILVVQHLPPSATYKSVLNAVLQRSSRLRVKWAEDGERMQGATVFLAPQDLHLWVDSAGALRLTADPKINRARPSADRLFLSVAAYCRNKCIAVVLSGALSDGAAGAGQIALNGGRVLAQNRTSCWHFDMPHNALLQAGVDFMCPPAILGHALISLVMVPGAADWLWVGRRGYGQSQCV